MDVDVAVASAPVNVLALIDDTDFKTRETSVAYNAAGMDLVWNFTTTAGVTTQTAVTPTTGGNYDWTNLGDGMYAIEIPASGGASINNDTEGVGWFTGVATGVLPWRGPFIGFRAAALNNSLIDAGTTGLLAPTTAARTLNVDASGNADARLADAVSHGGTLGSSTATLALSRMTVASQTSNTNAISATGNGTGHGMALTSGGGATGNGLTLLAASSNGHGLKSTGTGTGDGAELTAGASGVDLDADITGNITGNLSGSVGSVAGAVGSVTGNVGGNVVGSVASVTATVNANAVQISGDTTAADNAESFFDGTGYAGTNNVIPLVTTVTTVNGLAAGVITAASIAADAITAAKVADGTIDAATFAANAIDATALATSAVTEIAAGILAQTLAAKWGSLTVEQALGISVAAIAAGKTSGAGTGTFTIRDVADGTNIIVATTVGGNRTAVTVTP